MKRIVKQLVGSLMVVVTISGCTPKYSLFGCEVPEVKEAVYDNSSKATVLAESTKCYRNFLAAQQEIDSLRAAIKVCE